VPSFAFQSASSATVNEATLAHPVIVELTLASGSLPSDTTIDITDLLTGTASSGTDHTALAIPVTVTFPAGAANGATQIGNIPVIQDLDVEGNETVNLRLSNPSFGILGTTTNHAATITDDDSVTAQFATASSSVAEANTTLNVIVTLAVIGGGTLQVPLTVDLNDLGTGTATSATDYNSLASPVTVTFPIGASNGATQVVPVSILQDALVESDETINLQLSNPQGSPVFALGSTTNHSVTITNDDGSATVNFQSAISSTSEGGGTVTVVLELSTPGTALGSDVVVDITDLLTGTATSGTDYGTLATPVQVTFPAGSVNGDTAIFPISIVDDGFTEGNEHIDLQITGVSGPAVIGATADHELTILDNDGPFVSFQSTTSSVAETAGTHFVVVVLSRPGGGANANVLTVDVTDLLSGSATSATDYSALGAPVTLVFPPGAVDGDTQVVSIVLTDDALIEGSETIDLRLSNIVSLDGVVLGGPTNHEVTIVDDDSLVVTKTVSATNQAFTAGSNVAIGEVVTYQTVISVGEGTSTNVLATDTFPNNLNFQAGTLSVTLGNGGMSTSFVDEPTSSTYADPVLTITFGTINNPANGNPADDTITLTFDAVVANSATNNHSNVKTNTFEVSDGVVTGSDTTPVTIVEGNISVSKTVDNVTRCNSPATLPYAGDVLEYTLTIQETQGLDVFDLTITDVLSEYMLYDTSFTPTVSGAGNSIGAASVSGTGGAGDPQTLTWSTALGNADIDIAAGATIAIVYRVALSASIPGGSTIDNTATVGFTSIDGVDVNERTSAFAPGVDDYIDLDTVNLATRPTPVQFTIPASRRRSPTFIDANGVITGPGGPGVLTADDELILTNGAGVTFTGDGISGPPPMAPLTSPSTQAPLPFSILMAPTPSSTAS
jgi:fimbrial isopeptide formation D2 family protein